LAKGGVCRDFASRRHGVFADDAQVHGLSTDCSRLISTERLPQATGKETSVFLFKLVHPDGTPADPPTLRSAVPNWQAGDRIPLRAGRVLRVVDVRDHDPHELPVLVVEDMSE
jgi:hypothetical protein